MYKLWRKYGVSRNKACVRSTKVRTQATLDPPFILFVISNGIEGSTVDGVRCTGKFANRPDEMPIRKA